MKFRIFVSTLASILLAGGLARAKDTPDQKREKTRKMAAQTLEDLYKLQPTSRELIQKSAEYAVFSNMGTNLLSTAHSAGIAVNSRTKQDTFMTMISAGAGLGIGVKDYRVVFAGYEVLQGRRPQQAIAPGRNEACEEGQEIPIVVSKRASQCTRNGEDGLSCEKK